MNDQTTSEPHGGSTPVITRRTVVRATALGAAGLATGAALWRGGAFAGPDSSPTAGPGQRHGGPLAPHRNTAERVLVVIELEGGNDGLSTLVPVESGRYRDLRPTVAIEAADTVDWGDGWGLCAPLDAVSEFGLAALRGVGSRSPDLSHFEMQARWAAGSPREIPREGSGFLGRLCDAVDDGSLLVGVSLDQGTALAMLAQRAATVGIDSADGPGLWREGTDETQAAVRRAVAALAAPRPGRSATAGSVTPSAELAGGLGRALLIDDALGDLPDPVEHPDADAFGHQMTLVTRLLRADLGVRVVHVPMAGGGFDTHSDHAGTHRALMESLSAGLVAFSDDLQRYGLSDRVLIATTSEFGRRPGESDGGLDHGTASTMLLSGPVVGGCHGEPSSLRRLDDDDNLVATVEFDRYYATLASWLDVDPQQVLTGAPSPIPGVVLT